VKDSDLLLEIGRKWGEYYALSYAEFHSEPGVAAWKNVVKLCDQAQRLAHEADMKGKPKA
jgi:hypothetical protein